MSESTMRTGRPGWLEWVGLSGHQQAVRMSRVVSVAAGRVSMGTVVGSDTICTISCGLNADQYYVVPFPYEVVMDRLASGE